ncbi:MAG: protein kinase [Planctomycetes bacterium]|nr:protein kinase [Planctomycetota bacterium]
MANDPLPDPPPDDLLRRLSQRPGSASRYKLEGEVARGGMGSIIKIWDEDLRRHLAMKVVLGKGDDSCSGSTPSIDSKQLARFLEEAQVTGQLDHPGIVPVHELGLDSEGRVYFTMKLVKGRDLKQIFDLVFEGKEDWNETRALGLILKACEALAYAHDKGVIHRDLKPANVMVGSFGEVYVMDWGLSRVLGRKDNHDIRIRPESTSSAKSVKTDRRDAREETPDSPIVTMDGDIVGTPAYMPPEQARGEIERLGPRSDVYSIGAMLYHLLARRAPYTQPGTRLTNHTVLGLVVHGPPAALTSLRKDVPVELVAIVEKAMAREPSQRYADTLLLAEDLRAFLEHRVVGAYETGTWAETRKWVLRNRALSGSIAATLIIAVSGAIAFGVQKHEAEQATALAQRRASDLLTETRRAEHSEQLATENARLATLNGYATTMVAASGELRTGDMKAVNRLLSLAPASMRRWEWGYLNAESDTSLRVWRGEPSSISDDGQRVLTPRADGLMHVINAHTDEEIAVLGLLADSIGSASLSTRGEYLLAVPKDSVAGDTEEWDVSTARKIRELAAIGYSGSATYNSDDSRIILSGNLDSFTVLERQTGRELRTFQSLGYVGDTNIDPTARWFLDPNAGTITGVAMAGGPQQLDGTWPRTGSLTSFSSTGESVVTVNDAGCQVWETATGCRIADIAPTRRVDFAVISPDGSLVATASGRRVAVFEARTGNMVVALKDHLSAIVYARFSGDGTKVATLCRNGLMYVEDAHSGDLIAVLAGHDKWIDKAVFTPDGARILTHAVDGTIRVWDLECGLASVRLEDKRALKDAVFSNDGEWIATASENIIHLWDAARGTQVGDLKGHTDRVNSVEFSRDGRLVVSASDDGTAIVWHSTSGKQLLTLNGHSESVSSAGFSPTGDRVVTASMDKSVRIWDTESGSQLLDLRGHVGGVNSACFSGDGLLVLSASTDQTARLWNATSGVPVGTLKGHTDGVTWASFSDDGARVVTTSKDNTARVWNASSMMPLATLEGHTDYVTFATFSPDGERIVTASNDETARIWESASGAQLMKLEGHSQCVNSARFSRDGTRILTASTDCSARVWDSVPYAVRFAGRQQADATKRVGQETLALVLNSATDWVDADRRLREDSSLSPAVRHASLQLLSLRCSAVRNRVDSLDALRADRLWVATLLGLEPWNRNEDVGRSRIADLVSVAQTCQVCGKKHRTLESATSDDLLKAARNLVALDSSPGDAVLAFSLVNKAICLDQAVERPTSGIPSPADAMDEATLVRFWESSLDAGILAPYRSVLALSLFRLGQFDEALNQQLKAVMESPDDKKAEHLDLQHRLEFEVSRWRDGLGNLNRDEWAGRLATLDREIAAIQEEADVRLWMETERRYPSVREGRHK